MGNRLARIVIIVAASTCFGACGAARSHAPEIVTAGDARQLDGPVIVILPRASVVETEISPRHLSSSRRTTTTIDVQRALDRSLLGASPLTDLPSTAAPSSSSSSSELKLDLESIYASRDALEAMHQRGAKHLLVIELRAAFGCVYGGGPALVAHYGSIGMGALSGETTANRCQEEAITLTAYLFESSGRARWSARRDIDPGTKSQDLEPLIDRFLAHIPLTIPGYRIRGAPDAHHPCHIDDHDHADCT